jgi:hypothetical protein
LWNSSKQRERRERVPCSHKELGSAPSELVKRLFPSGPPQPLRLVHVSGFELFRDELDAGLGLKGVLRR